MLCDLGYIRCIGLFFTFKISCKPSFLSFFDMSLYFRMLNKQMSIFKEIILRIDYFLD